MDTLSSLVMSNPYILIGILLIVIMIILYAYYINVYKKPNKPEQLNIDKSEYNKLINSIRDQQKDIN